MEGKIKERKVIISRGLGSRWEKTFFLDVQVLILDGWRVAETGLREDASLRNYKGSMGKAVFYRGEDHVEETPEEEKPETEAPKVEVTKAEEPKILCEDSSLVTLQSFIQFKVHNIPSLLVDNIPYRSPEGFL